MREEKRDYSDTIEELAEIDQAEVDAERERLYAPMNRTEGVTWKELNMAISRRCRIIAVA